MKKKLLAVTLSLAVAMSLAGCGSSAAKGETAGASNDTQAAEAGNSATQEDSTQKDSAQKDSAQEDSEQEGGTQENSTQADGSESAQSENTAKTNGKTTKLTFVLDWTPNTNHTGLYVAQDKGYFAEAGLEVEIVQPPEDGATALVASGKAQFGVDFQDSLAPAFAREDPLPVTAVAAVIQHNTSGIISRKGEGMDTPKGMEDHVYATWDLPVEKAMIANVVAQDGGDFDKVKLIPSTVTDEVTALKSKQVDAIWVYYAWGGIATEVNDLPTDYFAFKDINPVFDYYTPVIVANNDFLKENPDVAKAFMSALAKGYEDAVKDPAEAADILCKAAPELDAKLVQASQEYLKDQYQSDAKSWGYIDGARWDAFYGWLNENKLVETEIPAGWGFSNDYLPQ